MSTKYWKQFTPFYFYTAAILVLGVAAATSETRPLAGILRLFVCGFLSWALVEYGLHRFVFHHSARMAPSGPSFSAAHQSHHDHPQAVDQLFSSLRMSAPVAFCYCLLAWAVLGSWQATVYVFVGLIAGYFRGSVKSCGNIFSASSLIVSLRF